MLKDSDPELQRSFLTARERHQRGDLASAEAIYSRLLTLDPADSEVLFLFGHLQVTKGALDAGLECLQLAQQLDAVNPQIPYTIGVILQEAGRLAESIAAYQSALALNPNMVTAWENLCTAYYDQQEFALGLAAAERARHLKPESPLAIRGAANCLAAMGRRAEALQVLEVGIHYHPANGELRIHHAWELMANGQFAQGWRALEWRHSRQGITDTPPRSVPWPRWNGESLVGKTILVYGEQGIGDEIMFAPWVQSILQAGGRCLLECEPRLEQLFARAFPQCLILRREDRAQIPWHAQLPPIDYCISAFSLPLYFQQPSPRSAYLTAVPQRVAYWRERLTALGPGRKVGISWRGGLSAKVRAIRSIPPDVFGELVDPQNVYISLQYGATAAEVTRVSHALHYFSVPNPLQDLEEFAALVSALDVVVSVDNSTIHLAGALGIKTLMLLPVYSEWRWGNAPTGVSPWYQSVDMIRQPVASEAGWRELVKRARTWIEHLETAPDKPLAEANIPLDCVQGTPAEIILPAATGRAALLVGDTHYWYHWGCACTSLGLHEGLRTCLDTIRVLPLCRLHAEGPAPDSLASLDSAEFFDRFEKSCADIVEEIKAADCVIVNGEGSIHGVGLLPLRLLYLAYVAKTRYGKRVAVVNHSCYPGEAWLADGRTPATAYYAKVYSALDQAVVREEISFKNLVALGCKPALGFDCLPSFLSQHGSPAALKRSLKVVFGGSVSWSAEMVACFVELARWAVQRRHTVEILSGSKAYLAGDEGGFVEALVLALERAGLAHNLLFPLSEKEWLSAIGSAALVVSGRFHYSIAAAFQGVPFLVAESNTEKITGLLAALAVPPDIAALPRSAYPTATQKARHLLRDEKNGRVSPQRLDMLRERTLLNFAWCDGKNAVPDDAQVTIGNSFNVAKQSECLAFAEPVMLRAYHDGHKGATAFFRNRPFLETFFSLLQDVHDGTRVKVLVHACSVGAEAWSLALWWLHKIQPSWRGAVTLDIAATDIDPSFLEYAQQGTYPAALLEGMTQEEKSWFLQDGNTFSVPDAARHLVRFLPSMNFVCDATSEAFDAILIMNALTYVTAKEQSMALAMAAKNARYVMGITAFHPDSIYDDLGHIGFSPCMQSHQKIHEAWGDRLSSAKLEPDSPEYSWRLPPYETKSPDYHFRYGTLFVRRSA